MGGKGDRSFPFDFVFFGTQFQMATVQCCGHRFENISAVLFDKDGTLANVEDYLCELGHARIRQIAQVVPDVAEDIAIALGISERKVSPTGIMAVASRKETEIAAAAYVAATGRGWVDSLRLVAAAFERAKLQRPQMEQTPLLSGGRSLIKQMKATGIKIGIVSADAHLAVGKFIEYYDLAPDIDWYCGASVAMPAKTAPDFLTYACTALRSLPERTLLIGDSASDLAIAQQGAAGFLGMVGGWSSPPSLPDGEITFDQLSQVECFD